MSGHSSGAEGNPELREFLRSRRSRITPEEAGLPVRPGTRRVPGLRREEVAQLAGVSVDYYVRLERGRRLNASESVLDAVARALHLNDTERTHLFALARPTRARPRPMPPQRVPTARFAFSRRTAITLGDRGSSTGAEAKAPLRPQQASERPAFTKSDKDH